MESSLETSLRELKTDSIDLYFIHEPRRGDVLPAGLGEALKQKKVEGKFGAYGISGLPSDVVYFLKERPELGGEAIQHNFVLDAPADLFQQPSAYRGVFHVLSGLLPAAEDRLRQDPALARLWSEKLSLDLTRRENLATAILALALHDNPRSMVLFFTSNYRRIGPVVKRLAQNSFSSESLAEFRELFSRPWKEIHAH